MRSDFPGVLEMDTEVVVAVVSEPVLPAGDGRPVIPEHQIRHGIIGIEGAEDEVPVGNRLGPPVLFPLPPFATESEGVGAHVPRNRISGQIGVVHSVVGSVQEGAGPAEPGGGHPGIVLKQRGCPLDSQELRNRSAVNLILQRLRHAVDAQFQFIDRRRSHDLGPTHPGVVGGRGEDVVVVGELVQELVVAQDAVLLVVDVTDVDVVRVGDTVVHAEDELVEHLLLHTAGQDVVGDSGTIGHGPQRHHLTRAEHHVAGHRMNPVLRDDVAREGVRRSADP